MATNPPAVVGIDTGIRSTIGQCNINSGYPGDEACLAPPEPGKGIQIHIGPNDYNDAAEVAMFLMDPGDESSECFADKLPNMEAFHYLQYELSGRPGTHHIINSMVRNSDIRGFIPVCESFGDNRVGPLPGASKPHMKLSPVAPENAKLGIPVEPNLGGQFDMHYFNFTDAPILREFWLNLYFVDPANVEETPESVVGFGGLGWTFAPIQPGTAQVYKYECPPIETDGRILQLLGHTHAHGDRFTAHIRRASGERIKVFEAFDYLEPRVFNYNSVVENPGFGPGTAGAYTGILEVNAGDVLEWECDVNNDSMVPLRYTNFVETGEMCNIWGQAVGPAISCFLQ